MNYNVRYQSNQILPENDPPVNLKSFQMRFGMLTAGKTVSFLLGILAAFLVIRFSYSAAEQRKLFLASIEPQQQLSRIDELKELEERTEQQNERPKTEETPKVDRGILGQYAKFAEENNEFIGWIKIADTKIDNPVMYSPAEPQKYLQLSFNQEKNQNGEIFADYRCGINPDSDNIILYGHNMKSGKMFASVVKYQKESYYREHPLIEFDSLFEQRKYRVLAAFFDRVYYEDEDVFKFYNFIDAENSADFDHAIEQFKKKSIYDTGVEAKYGDKLVTLVTCTYQVENGRFVVIAKREE